MKRKAVLFASLGAAVVVVAVIVFLALNSSSGGNNTGTPASRAPGTSSSAGASKSPPSSAISAGLGKTPTDAPVSNFSAAGQRVVDFFGTPSQSWNLLTPAAQGVYGSEPAFQAYWKEHPLTNIRDAKAEKGTTNLDGSLDISLTLGGTRPSFRVISSGGQLLIDADTHLQQQQ
jgi:hypothetical protein